MLRRPKSTLSKEQPKVWLTLKSKKRRRNLLKSLMRSSLVMIQTWIKPRLMTLRFIRLNSLSRRKRSWKLLSTKLMKSSLLLLKRRIWNLRKTISSARLRKVWKTGWTPPKRRNCKISWNNLTEASVFFVSRIARIRTAISRRRESVELLCFK